MQRRHWYEAYSHIPLPLSSPLSVYKGFGEGFILCRDDDGGMVKKIKTATKAVKFQLLPITKAKKDRLQVVADNFREIYAVAASRLPSLEKTSQYGSRRALNRLRIELHPITIVAAQIAQEAIEYARVNYEAMQTQKSKIQKTIERLEYEIGRIDEKIEKPGKRERVRKKLARKIRRKRRGLRTPYPILTHNIIRIHNQSWSFVHKNDRIYVVLPVEKIGTRYRKIWLPLKESEHYRHLISNTNKWGVGQLDLDTDTFITSITVKREDVRYEPETFIGIDLGLNNIATLAVVQDGKVVEVRMWSGKEVEHTRRRFREYRRTVSKIGRVDLLNANRGREQRWMAYTNHVVSKQIAEIVLAYPKPLVVFEELYRFVDRVPWNFYQIRQMIEYKVVPVRTLGIHPARTSVICNRCGGDDPDNRHGVHFHCTKCGYRVHADVNAAINIAKKGEWVLQQAKKKESAKNLSTTTTQSHNGDVP